MQTIPRMKKQIENNMGHESETTISSLRFRDMTPMMENHKEKNMENEMESGVI